MDSSSLVLGRGLMGRKKIKQEQTERRRETREESRQTSYQKKEAEMDSVLLPFVAIFL